MLKKLLSALALVGLLAGVAFAANVNLLQKQDGRTVWIDPDGNTYPAGSAGFPVLLENISSASTTYLVTHKGGTITKIYSVVHGAVTTGDAVLDASILSSGAWAQIGSSTTTLTISATSAPGDVDSMEPDATNLIAAGEVIGIHTDGGSTNDIDATIVVVIE